MLVGYDERGCHDLNNILSLSVAIIIYFFNYVGREMLVLTSRNCHNKMVILYPQVKLVFPFPFKYLLDKPDLVLILLQELN